ncbi:MAG TPA: Na+/H+ antiporter subunit G [Anaerolinea thermolimosa]|uniref:Na+/H+ antiporter subunit G n=1 Tax=Anaerolinea thermolimosa TaxID=229919 RepID=A0A3D1JHG4_9CHLR|nr:monovalent cation/H(+) antiporter subunit G [Anaerolinea thermolimosa]GAP08116.1 multisubunit sodium/proton antiporter, MrpG subunit [Anaerolinea thermolimosa]HCE17056.1 Na+/H+ antiporter subunit G [Anaerolinea thermolimosa]
MSEWIIALVMFGGAFFIFLASVGILRMPDLFLRMSATSKAATLGAGLMLGATALAFGEFSVATRALATIVFLLITTPVAAHMIARAAYFDGVPLFPGTLLDELRGHYHLTNHTLDSVVQDSTDTWIPEIEGDDFPEVR